jgi:uncharacterized protein
LRLTRHENVDAFLADAGEFLAAREAEHNLILGLTSRLVREPLLYGEPAYFAVVEDDGRVVGASMRTPPHNLILSELDHDGTIPLLVADAHAAFESLPGVVGPKARAAEFARAWQVETGASSELGIAQRVFEADRVEEPRPTGGSMRDYTPADRDVAIRWMDEFAAEALVRHGPIPETAADMVDRREQDPDGGLVLWDDGGPVSIAGFGGPTPNGIRIGPVYTPPDLRGRGYASALTAALTQRLLDGGRRFCFLYTDLSNPTSNSIYQRIGYRPVADADSWSFAS